MKIALLSYEYPPDTGFGGIGTYVWHQARALVRLGHEVHVLAGATEATALRTSEDEGVRVHRFWADGLPMDTAHALGRFRLWWTRQRLKTAWSMYRGLLALHRVHRFDVVEAPECGADGALVPRLVDVPLVVRLHSPARLIMPYYDVSRADRVLCSSIEARAIRTASSLTSCSRFLADAVRTGMGVARPISVVPNGIDLERFDAAHGSDDVHGRYGLPRGRALVVFTGRMERRKGVHLLPEIARRVLRTHDAAIVLAGSDLFGYLRDHVLPSLSAESLRGSIHWVGRLELPALRRLVEAADVLLLPSLWENCPYACLEGMASGRAVVCADQGGMPELVEHGRNGLLARCDDAAAFAEAVVRLLADTGLRRRLGEEARRTVERSFTDIQMAEKTVEIYRGVAPGAGKAAA